MLVSGESGVGKSSLVNQLQKAVVSRRGLFASGKFDQYMREVPYATLAQAFQGLVRTLLGESDAELRRWRQALNEALGSNGQLIVNLVPELELVIGKQPPVADLPALDAQRRFQMVFRRFLAAFASDAHPLVLFVDDLQWLDAATLELFEHLATHPDVTGLLLIGAYRTGEVGPSHPLEAVDRGDRPVEGRGSRDRSGPALDRGCRPVRRGGAALRTASARCLSLNCCTRGPPAIRSSRCSSSRHWSRRTCSCSTSSALAWRSDIDRIRAKSYSDNVVDLVTEKLGRLSDPSPRSA